MLKKAGTQLFITHPQITQVPSVSAETYDNEIKRAARICRVVRAQKHKLVLFFIIIHLMTKKFFIENKLNNKHNVIDY